MGDDDDAGQKDQMLNPKKKDKGHSKKSDGDNDDESRNHRIQSEDSVTSI